jgi:thioredoxin-like negative regulator of GroEL
MIEILLEAERALTHGLVDQAERLYGQVAAADPRNSIAAVGLARVALERGDELGAYLHARAALRIDPENPAAQHLVMRMAEVIAGRGEKVPQPEDDVAVEGVDALPSHGAAAVEPTVRPAGERPAHPHPGLIGRLLGRRRKS